MRPGRMSPAELCREKDCPAYFRITPKGILNRAPWGPIYSRDRQRTLLWARGASGRQKRKVRKALRRMAKEIVADQQRILYGDPNATPPAGIIYANQKAA